VSFNLSMWYKLSEHTRYAIYITLLGLIITVILDIFLMPLYGCYAAAWSRLLSYVIMIVVSYFLGLRYYPIPYNLKAIFTYFAVGLGLFGLSDLLVHQGLWLRLTANTILLGVYIIFVFRFEKINPLLVLSRINKSTSKRN
jgi:O-antigen/teichoic acid export membrane protein